MLFSYLFPIGLNVLTTYVILNLLNQVRAFSKDKHDIDSQTYSPMACRKHKAH